MKQFMNEKTKFALEQTREKKIFSTQHIDLYILINYYHPSLYREILFSHYTSFHHITRYSKTGHDLHSIRMGGQDRKKTTLEPWALTLAQLGPSSCSLCSSQKLLFVGLGHSCYFTSRHVEMGL